MKLSKLFLLVLFGVTLSLSGQNTWVNSDSVKFEIIQLRFRLEIREAMAQEDSILKYRLKLPEAKTMAFVWFDEHRKKQDSVNNYFLHGDGYMRLVDIYLEEMVPNYRQDSVSWAPFRKMMSTGHQSHGLIITMGNPNDITTRKVIPGKRIVFSGDKSNYILYYDDSGKRIPNEIVSDFLYDTD